MSDEGFIKLRRGLDEHLDRIDGDALRLYLRMQFRADWRPRDSMGLVTANLADLAESFGWNRWKRGRAIAELGRGGYVTVIKAGNQHSASVFRIEKYDSACRTNAVSTGEHAAKNSGACRISAASDAVSTPVKPNEIKRPERSKKLVEEEVKSRTRKPTVTVTDTTLKKLGILTLPEACSDFVSLVEENQPFEGESLAKWGERILQLCKERHVRYPAVFLKTKKAAERSDTDRPAIPLPPGSVQAQIEEERRRRMAL